MEQYSREAKERAWPETMRERVFAAVALAAGLAAAAVMMGGCGADKSSERDLDKRLGTLETRLTVTEQTGEVWGGAPGGRLGARPGAGVRYQGAPRLCREPPHRDRDPSRRARIVR